MLSSGVESLLDSSVSAVIEELYPGLPESISTELMAVPGPSLGLDAQSDGPVPVLAHRDGPWTSAAGNFCQKTEDFGDMLQVISHGPAESFPEGLLQAGDLAKKEKSRKRHLRKLDCFSDGYQKEDEEAQAAEDHLAEYCPLTLEESWLEQEDPHLNKQGAKSLRTCGTEIAGSLRSTEENQANVQVTAETLPKLTEDVQGMKADGTRIFSKAGYRNDRVSKGLPPESNQYPDVDTVMARAGVSETSVLGFLEPLKVLDIGAATNHPRETNDYSGSKAHAAMPLRTGGNGVTVLEIREEKLPRQNPLNEFSTSFANYQTCQQDEENYFKGPVPEQNEPHELFSAESCRTLSTQSSEVLCPVLKSICYLDFGNTPLESSSAAHGIINEVPQKYLPQNIKHHTLYDCGTGFFENQTSAPVPVEQISVLRNKGLSNSKTDPRELRATIGESYSSESEEAAEVWRKIAVGDNIEICSRHEAQEAANSEHCHSPVFSSVASSSEEVSKEKFKIFPSEGDKLKKVQWQFSVSDPCKNAIKENRLWVERSNIASRETGQRDICFYSTANKIPPLSNHSCLGLSTKLEKDSPKAQLLEKESESNTTSEELADGLAGAAEADSNDSLSTGNKKNLFYTLNVTLPPVLQKSRKPHYNECVQCTANEVSCRDKAWDNLSRKKLIGASGATAEQVAEVLLHKDKFMSSLNSMTFDNPKTASRVYQMNIKSSAGNTETMVTGLENEYCHTWICNNQSIEKKGTAASTSCILSGSTCVDEVFLNSHSFGVEVDKIEENDNLEGESSSGYNSKEAIIFPGAHAPLAHRSFLCENDWDKRGIALHGINDIPTGKNMFCSAYTAEKSAATLARDEFSNKYREVVEQFDLCKGTGSEIVCDRDEAKEQTGMCASQTDEFDKTRPVDSPSAPEGNQRNKTSEQLLVRYLNKNTCAHNFGFYNSLLGPWKRELGTCEQEEMPLPTADPSDCSTLTCDPHPALASVNIPTQHAGQTEETLCPNGNQFYPCHSEFYVPVLGSEDQSESLTNQPNIGLQTMGGSVGRNGTDPSHSEEVLLNTGGDLPLLDHKFAREARFEGALHNNVTRLDSLIGVKNEDSSRYMDSINDVIEEKTIRLQEREDRCERNNKGARKENFPDDKPHCSQQACFIKRAKEKAKLVLAGTKMQQSLPKTKWLVENLENTISAQFLPISSIYGSLSYKPENRNVLSDTENRGSLSITPVLNNSHPQLTFEPGKETDDQRGVGPSHFGKFDIQESCVETQEGSETVSVQNSPISLPEKEKLCMSPESTQRDNSDSSSAEVFSKDTSMTKILSVTISVKKKSSHIGVPSSRSQSAAGSLYGAKSSRVCAHSKGSLKGEGLCTPTVKDMDMSSPKSSGEEKCKDTDKPENINVLSDTENRGSLSITPVLNNSHPQLTFEPGKETDDQRGVGPSHFGKFDIQESCVETQEGSETVSVQNSPISLPEKEKLCMSPESTQRDNSDSSSAEVFSKDTSMTKILSVTISVKKKSSHIGVPSSGNESAAGSLYGAKSSRVCAHSKGSLKGEGLCTPTVKDMDMSSPKSSGEEKCKDTDKPENINVLSDTENRGSLSITPVLNNSHPQLTFEPGKETDDQRGVGPSHFGKFDIQESCVETQEDSETVSVQNSPISLPEKEKLCMSPESTQRDISYSDKKISKDTSMTKILSVTISVKKKSSHIGVPSSRSQSAAGSLYGAKSSRVCAHSKGSLKGEGLCTPTVKDMDMCSPKSSGEEKCKDTDKPENINVLSDTENRGSLSITPVLNNSHPWLTYEPGKETDDQRGVGPSHFGKFDIQESCVETQEDSENVSAQNSHISLPEKEKLCMSPESTQRDISYSDKKISKDTSMTKILSVTISVKRKSSNIEVLSSGNESAAGSLYGAESSRVCAHSKESLKGEGLCTPTVKAMDTSSPKCLPGEEKFKNTYVEEKIGKEVAPRGRLPKNCSWALLEDSKESVSKIVPLRTENYGKVLEEIPRSKLNNLSKEKERQNDTKLPNLAGTSVFSETLHDCQAGAVSDTEAAPEVQDHTTPTFSPPLSTLSDSCKEPFPNGVVCSEVCVPYKLNARNKDNVKEVTESQDKLPTHAVCKENGALGSERLDQIEECQVLKQRKYGKMEVHQLGMAQQEQKLEHQEKAKIILQPSTLQGSELLCSSSAESMTSTNIKVGGASEEICAVRASESKLCSTLQEVKRPKITTDFISSQCLKTQDSEMENLNLNLGYDGIPGAFGTTKKRRGTTNMLRGPLPLKIQPGRTCKKVPTLHQLKTVRKIKKITSSPFSEIPLEIFPKQENTLLESLYFACKPPTVEEETAVRFVHMPRQRAKRCSLLNSLKFRKCTKEPSLLSKLSAVASKLLAPAKSSHNLEPLPYSSEILPVGARYSQCRSRNLLEAFSCINRNVHSRWAGSWCTKMFSFQPLALYPAEATKISSSDLSHKPPTPFLDTSVFPVSFHIKLDSSPVTDLRGITSQHPVHHSPVVRESLAPASKWALSFLLSQSCSDTTAFKEDSSVNKELPSSHSTPTPRTVAVHPDPGRNAVAGRRGGLHTVLALSSSACYRIWTRRRNLTSHIPTIQRLFISQLAQGLKGDRYPRCVSDDLVSSLPYSLGRVLSIWSQHGPSARPSEITPLHSSHCKWQPSVGFENSCAMLPHLPVQSMGALQTAGHAIRLETSFPVPLPKPRALPESLPSPPRLSASELQIPALDEADASVPACLRPQDDTELKKKEAEKRPKKVSQIRIRKTVPKPDPNLTPMGLPKPKRLKKKEFSLEEIYTNKNYKSPPPARSLETIFEEPKEKNGHLISVSQQKRKRILEFQDFTLPRKRKIRGKIKAVGSFTRAKRAALQSAELDVLLSQKLMDLEAFFAEEVEQEQASSI
ncbi:PREDICTED: protein PRR14L [Ficedula albicollis]|uniref:Proline rich 14 like n=3 Tax=Passeriformes TaxID=9126 RepID=U3JY80_FICAL|nr:PREDICTED: protein PRR14L [Ficedula albicollis]